MCLLSVVQQTQASLGPEVPGNRVIPLNVLHSPSVAPGEDGTIRKRNFQATWENNKLHSIWYILREKVVTLNLIAKSTYDDRLMNPLNAFTSLQIFYILNKLTMVKEDMHNSTSRSISD